MQNLGENFGELGCTTHDHVKYLFDNGKEYQILKLLAICLSPSNYKYTNSKCIAKCVDVCRASYI